MHTSSLAVKEVIRFALLQNLNELESYYCNIDFYKYKDNSRHSDVAIREQKFVAETMCNFCTSMFFSFAVFVMITNSMEKQLKFLVLIILF